MQVLPIAEFPLFSAIADRISSSRKMPAYEARVAYVFSAIAMFSPFSLVGQKPPRGLRNKIAEHLCISKGHASHEITRVAALARLDGRLKPLLDDVLQSVLQEISALNRNVP